MAQDKESEEFVAIKILSKLDIIKKQKDKAVMREKDLLKKLNGSDFIVNLKQTFMDQDSLYFVFENAKYGTLTDLIKHTGPLNLDTCRVLVAQIVQSLSTCFEHNIMHRDVKPENILIDERMRCVLIDFGDAKSFEDEIFSYRITQD